MRHRILLHITWTTRERRPRIDAAVATFLADLLPRIAHEERSELLAIGIVSTHLHLVVRVNPSTSLPRLMQRFKGSSATLHRRKYGSRLQWAKGYNVDSLGERALAIVLKYVDNQHLHHPDEAISGWPQPND